MILCNGNQQVERSTGEPTGFLYNNDSPILVGDRMLIRHLCNCDRCNHYDKVTILWNNEWNAYGMFIDGRWVSGMGICSGYSKI